MRFYAIISGRRIRAYCLAPTPARALYLCGRPGNEVAEIPADKVDEDLLERAGERQWREGELCAAGVEELA